MAGTQRQSGKRDSQDGSRLVYVLTQIAKVLELTEIERRLMGEDLPASRRARNLRTADLPLTKFRDPAPGSGIALPVMIEAALLASTSDQLVPVAWLRVRRDSGDVQTAPGTNSFADASDQPCPTSAALAEVALDFLSSAESQLLQVK